MKKVTLITTAALLIAGCTTQPDFDPTVTEVKTIDGKTFNIPKGATPSPHIVTPKEIAFYQKSGVADCKD